MKIIRNKFIPFPGYKAMNICGILFVRGNAYIDQKTMNHERIHTEQWKELLWIGFLLWYVVEWIIRLFAFKGGHHAYKNISFEREANSHEAETEYIKNRKRFAFTRYIREKKA
ncbi:MAG: hypothetical protein ACOYIG_03320 [Acetivibrionales bacterium]|jgi:hypothetical protein